MSLILAKAIQERLDFAGSFTYGSIVNNTSLPYSKEDKIAYINYLLEKEEIYEVFKASSIDDQYRTFHRCT